jgi:hypothetical protein
MGALNAANAQLVYAASKGQNVMQVRMKSDLGRIVLAKKSQHALVVGVGGVNLSQQVAIAFPQRFQAHLWNDIGRAIHIVTRKFIHQAIFFLDFFRSKSGDI